MTNQMNQNKVEFKMTPGYITGLTQTDGTFFCIVTLSAAHLFGLQFRPKFSITCDLSSIHVLNAIKRYFGCGYVFVNEKTHSAEYVVASLTDLVTIIIPHFKEYPLFCAKLHSFNLLTTIALALFNKENRTEEGRRDLLILALSMNKTTNRTKERIDLLFSKLGIEDTKDIKLVSNLINSIDTEISDDVLAGIIDGDGSFYISFQRNGKITTGFKVVGDSMSRPLLEAIQRKLNGIGTITTGTKNELILTVSGLNQVNDILIPFMDLNPLLSERASHYEGFKHVSQMLKNKKPLTLEDKIELVELYYNSNKDGKRRLFTKSEYLEILKSNNST